MHARANVKRIFRHMVLSNTERCWSVNICDRGAFWKCRTSEASVVFLKSAEITNVYIHSRVRYGLYHMTFVREVVDNPDRPDFAYYKSFPTVAIKISLNKSWRQSAEQAGHDAKIMHARANVKGISRHMVCWNTNIFRLEVDLQLELQCRNISIFALTCFWVKNIIVYNGNNL